MSLDRLQELLVQQATEALSDKEQSELDALLTIEPTADRSVFERAAATLHLATLRVEKPLPPDLRAAIEQDAAAYFAARERDPDDS